MKHWHPRQYETLTAVTVWNPNIHDSVKHWKHWQYKNTDSHDSIKKTDNYDSMKHWKQ